MVSNGFGVMAQRLCVFGLGRWDAPTRSAFLQHHQCFDDAGRLVLGAHAAAHITVMNLYPYGSPSPCRQPAQSLEDFDDFSSLAPRAGAQRGAIRFRTRPVLAESRREHRAPAGAAHRHLPRLAVERRDRISTLVADSLYREMRIAMA
jgi:hypothetical protein